MNGPDACWDDKPETYRLREITRVDFGGDYEEALRLVGGYAEYAQSWTPLVDVTLPLHQRRDYWRKTPDFDNNPVAPLTAGSANLAHSWCKGGIPRNRLARPRLSLTQCYPSFTMPTAKQQVELLLRQLPENCSLEDIQYHIYVLDKARKGLEDSQQRGTVPPRRSGRAFEQMAHRS
ncbi:MAG TPA: hypothetical protein VF311_10690 [Terriglobales bacterium]